jgi:hypothetical protein
MLDLRPQQVPALALVAVAVGGGRSGGIAPIEAYPARPYSAPDSVVQRLAPTVRSRRAERPQAALWTRCTRSASPGPGGGFGAGW